MPVNREHPCGTRTIRLADIPKDQRLAAARKLSRVAKDDGEALRLFLLAAEPGDKGGRIVEEAA